jgi:hypothetical protein
MIKKFFEFIGESKSSVDCKEDWSDIIHDTPQLSNLISSRKIELKDNKIHFDGDDRDTVEILNTYLGIDTQTKK